MAEDHAQPCEVPLCEQLERISEHLRLEWTDTEGLCASHFVPIGRLAHRVADTLQSQERTIGELTSALEHIRDHVIKLRKGTDDWFELVEIEAMASKALGATQETGE